MNIIAVPFTIVDWSTVEPVEHKGETGTSYWRSVEQGNVRARRVEYSARFESDHWCSRGHVGLVLEGELLIKLKDGRKFALLPGMSFATSNDEANPHQVSTERTTIVFIVD